jgi:phosphate transport system protein
MLKDTMDAYAKRDVDLAVAVWNRDKELDEIYSSLFRELLTYMMEDPRHVSASVQTLFMARDIERIGDRTTNIVEMVRFLIGGRPVEEERPKADLTKTMLVGDA